MKLHYGFDVEEFCKGEYLVSFHFDSFSEARAQMLESQTAARVVDCSTEKVIDCNSL